MDKPGLFGLRHCNHDFLKKSAWGKNIFASTFPVALGCYMHDRHIQPVYLQMDADGQLIQTGITVQELYGMDPLSEDIFFAFETALPRYQPLVVGKLPGTDVVIMTRSGESLAGLEIKLTALPDNSTCDLNETAYGCEIVTRPDTIVYLALSIALVFQEQRPVLREWLSPFLAIENWRDPQDVIPFLAEMAQVLQRLMRAHVQQQQPLVMQPIWKTEGKSLTLHQNAFDMFVWSNFAFTRLFIRAGSTTTTSASIDRPSRALIWLIKMLLDFATEGQIQHRRVIDGLSYDTRNDKAFSVSGRITQPFMASDALRRPRIERQSVKALILGGGQMLLSPERRLDAVLMSMPELFTGA